MEKKERNLIVNIIWKPFFAAIMTTVLISSTDLPPVLIGITLGLASSIACYLDLKKIYKNKRGYSIKMKIRI